MFDVILDGFLDCLKLVPFLYLSYLLVEYAEHKMSAGTRQLLYRAGKTGPLLGALIGIIPQCGFSAAAAGLFAAGIISPGTLLAVFLSTSDEMLPIMISEHVAVPVLVKILLTKVVCATLAGLITDMLAAAFFGWKYEIPEHQGMCEHEHCGCNEHGIWYSAMNHTLKTAFFILIVTLALGIGFELIGSEHTAQLLGAVPGLQEAAAALIGMIPNCAASVLITELFLSGLIHSGALFSGLLCGAGTGLLVLFRENENHKTSLALTAALYVSGLLLGILSGIIVPL